MVTNISDIKISLRTLWILRGGTICCIRIGGDARGRELALIGGDARGRELALVAGDARGRGLARVGGNASGRGLPLVDWEAPGVVCRGASTICYTHGSLVNITMDRG